MAEELYTPICPELIELLREMRAKHGTWAEVVALSGYRSSPLRKAYRIHKKTVRLSFLDALCSTTEVGHASDFTWFTPKDLAVLGLWEWEDMGTRKARQQRSRADKKRERAKLRRRARRAEGQWP
jgi:hypothetical protein